LALIYRFSWKWTEDAAVPELDDTTLDFLFARAGLSPTEEQRAGLKAAYLHVAGMAERVRRPRGRMAEPVLTYGFAEEDLA
jgi:hypothetical protein